MNIIQRPSTHFDERSDGSKPSFIIIHYTDTKTLEEAEDYFLGRRLQASGGRVSAHYMIDFDGTVVQYVDEEKRAWHAGASHWAGMSDLNHHSIGIELVNPGRTYGYRPFPAAQMEALMKLVRDIMTRRSISPFRVLAHSDIAPARKQDPGELFDWKAMANAGLAVWPDPQDEDRRIARDYLRDKNALREAFLKVGYDPKADLESIVTAFQRHFYPEAFRHPEKAGQPTEAMAARLHWLVRNRPNL